MTSFRRTLLYAAPAAGVLLALTVWATDAPPARSLRDFQPAEVARLETAMWKSYYAHERLRLFGQLATLLREQYHLSRWRACVTAYRAARAAAVFQRGHSHADYEKALPHIVSFYAAIRRASSDPFDVQRAARLELDWWIIHRERNAHAPGDLETDLAALQAELYGLPAPRFAEHARLRAEAMTLCDRIVQSGHGSDGEWAEIESVLRRSWTSLRQAAERQRKELAADSAR